MASKNKSLAQINKSGPVSKTTKRREIPQAELICMRVSMANNIQKPRSRERSSLTAGLVVFGMALALVGSLLELSRNLGDDD